MKARIKGKLPDAPEPTRTVRVDADPHKACFAEAVQRQKQKERKAKEIKVESWQKGFKPRSNRKWTAEDLQKAADLIAQGYSHAYVADALGVTHKSVDDQFGTEKGGIPEE